MNNFLITQKFYENNRKKQSRCSNLIWYMYFEIEPNPDSVHFFYWGFFHVLAIRTISLQVGHFHEISLSQAM